MVDNLRTVNSGPMGAARAAKEGGQNTGPRPRQKPDRGTQTSAGGTGAKPSEEPAAAHHRPRNGNPRPPRARRKPPAGPPTTEQTRAGGGEDGDGPRRGDGPDEPGAARGPTRSRRGIQKRAARGRATKALSTSTFIPRRRGVASRIGEGAPPRRRLQAEPLQEPEAPTESAEGCAERRTERGTRVV